MSTFPERAGPPAVRAVRAAPLAAAAALALAALAVNAPLAWPPAGQATARAQAARPTLRPGQSGEDVRTLQRLLRQRGFFTGPLTGYFGPATEHALRRFQRSRGLTPDGVAGPATWRALLAAGTTRGSGSSPASHTRPAATEPPRRPPAPPGPPIPPPSPGDMMAGQPPGSVLSGGRVVEPSGSRSRPPTGAARGGEAALALTFDDGPDPALLPAILKALADAGVRATFFFAGRDAERHPDLVRRVARGGHEVECHGYYHADLTRLPPTAVRSEIGRCVRALEDITGRRPRFLRPPRGAYDARVIREARRQRLRLALWDNVFLPDRPYPGAPDLIGSVLRVARPGAVVMLHATEPGTAAALPALLAALRQAGYRSVALDELSRASAPPAGAPPSTGAARAPGLPRPSGP